MKNSMNISLKMGHVDLTQQKILSLYFLQKGIYINNPNNWTFYKKRKIFNTKSNRLLSAED